MASSFNQDNAADIFFRAFKDYAESLISDLPYNTDPNDTTIADGVHTIATQLNNDIARLEYVVEVVQARVSEDEDWAPTAVKVYEVLGYAIDSAFPDVHGRTRFNRGTYLVRDQMMRACQNQFQPMMNEHFWNRGLINFLGHLCTVGSITSITPGIVLHALDLMVDSPFVGYNDNFDLLMRFVMVAGPYLDGQAGYQDHLVAWLEKLRERTKLFRSTERLAVQGVLRLMERGWRMGDLEVEAEYDYL